MDSTVNIAPGTYTEDIQIDKTLTIQGIGHEANQSIVLRGDLVVTETEALTLMNASLKIGEDELIHETRVEPRGSLRILDTRIYTESRHGFNLLSGRRFKYINPPPATLVIRNSFIGE